MHNKMNYDNNEFLLQDFTKEENFEQFIALIRGETEDPVAKLCANYFECEHINGCDLPVDGNASESQFILEEFVDEANGGSNNIYSNNNNVPDSSLEGISKYINDEVAEEEGEDSSAMMTAGTPTSQPLKRSGGKADRSRTLISERRRRGRMKEKLYALRSLVPNITKMDKASIIGDAALYVQDLQSQANNLRAEIASLESSLTHKQRDPSYDNTKAQLTNIPPLLNKTVLQMEVYQVEESGYHVRLVCNTGKGVSTSLYKAIDSLTNFNVHSTNLSTIAHSFLFTFTLHVGGYSELGMNLANLKLWIAGALLNQGFDFETLPPP